MHERSVPSFYPQRKKQHLLGTKKVEIYLPEGMTGCIWSWVESRGLRASRVFIHSHVIINRVVWWVTSQRREPSREVTLSQLGRGTDLRPNCQAKLESKKQVSVLKSTSTGCCIEGREAEKDKVIMGREVWSFHLVRLTITRSTTGESGLLMSK